MSHQLFQAGIPECPVRPADITVLNEGISNESLVGILECPNRPADITVLNEGISNDSSIVVSWDSCWEWVKRVCLE